MTEQEDATVAVKEEIVLDSLVDVVAIRIVAAAASRPLTVRDLSIELKLPIASLYRKVHDLQAAGALVARRVRDSTTGKATCVYSAAVSSLHLEFGTPTPRYRVGFAPAETP
ncbi:MAG TPA: hypothetical protein VNZ52_12145 [Candidatus Thermoplasmatota archaeon]|nr:hypothetical protein [Candidatus Thermoplasmatota archaeon]